MILWYTVICIRTSFYTMFNIWIFFKLLYFSTSMMLTILIWMNRCKFKSLRFSPISRYRKCKSLMMKTFQLIYNCIQSISSVIWILSDAELLKSFAILLISCQCFWVFVYVLNIFLGNLITNEEWRMKNSIESTLTFKIFYKSLDSLQYVLHNSLLFGIWIQ